MFRNKRIIDVNDLDDLYEKELLEEGKFSIIVDW